MRTLQKNIVDSDGNSIEASRCLIWGNNVAWICVNDNCGQLLGNRTGNGDYQVDCSCGVRYEIQREGHLKKALGVAMA